MGLDWQKKDITNEKFGRLTAISEVKERNSNGTLKWNCLCDCGKMTVVTGVTLRAGKTRSCGCLRLETVRLPYGEAAFNNLFKSYGLGAKSRDLIFDLDKVVFKNLVIAPCFYCGILWSCISKNSGRQSFHGNFEYNGIDRVDNSKGYSEDNVVTCCKTCNRMKMAHSKNEFLLAVKNIYEHLKLESFIVE